jgi:hypothetical protein
MEKIEEIEKQLEDSDIDFPGNFLVSLEDDAMRLLGAWWMYKDIPDHVRDYKEALFDYFVLKHWFENWIPDTDFMPNPEGKKRAIHNAYRLATVHLLNEMEKMGAIFGSMVVNINYPGKEDS